MRQSYSPFRKESSLSGPPVTVPSAWMTPSTTRIRAAFDSYGPFPKWWQNPFRRDKLNSGAILVGAGAPAFLVNLGRTVPGSTSRISGSRLTRKVGGAGWYRPDTATCRGECSRTSSTPATSVELRVLLRSLSALWRVFRGRSRPRVVSQLILSMPASFYAEPGRDRSRCLVRVPVNPSAIAQTSGNSWLSTFGIGRDASLGRSGPPGDHRQNGCGF